MEKVQWLDYAVNENTDKVAEILIDNGYPEPETVEETRDAANIFIAEKGNHAIAQLFEAHPDKNAINKEKQIPEGFKNTVERFINFKINQDDKKMIKDVLVMAIAFFAVYKIFKIFKND
jgi:hypothetical protein